MAHTLRHPTRHARTERNSTTIRPKVITTYTAARPAQSTLTSPPTSTAAPTEERPVHEILTRLGDAKSLYKIGPTNMFLLAAVATAFNLVCAGQLIGANPVRLSLFIRVNLETQRYCLGSCPETLAIARTTETAIIFSKDPDGPISVQRRVSRESGANLSSVKTDLACNFTQLGQCEVAPFTGFPARKF